MATTPEPLVRFVIGGVQKAGTSALARYLGTCAALHLPDTKEAHVFDAPDFDDQWLPPQVDRQYAARFTPARTGVLHGDATPVYILHPRFIDRIARYNPAMRWIVLLRDPVARAVSHYQMERQRGHERWPLWAAMLFEGRRLHRHREDFRRSSPLRRQGYRLRGDYARQLDALYARFPAEQVLLLSNTDLRKDPTTTVRTVCAFLGVTPPAGELPPQTVFAGDYPPLASDGLQARVLRWLMRRELRAMRDRYGITFD